jgi:hypothetical protein
MITADAYFIGGVMSRLWRIPSVIADYAVGTLIVMLQLGVLWPRQQRAAARRRGAAV